MRTCRVRLRSGDMRRRPCVGTSSRGGMVPGGRCRVTELPGGVRWGERAPDIPVSSAGKPNPWRPPAPLRRWEANLSPCFGSTSKCVSWSRFCSRRSCQLAPRGSWGQGQTRGQGVVPTGEGGPARLPVTLPPAPRRSAGSPLCSPRAAFCTVLESGMEDLPPVCLSCHCVWL